MYKYQSRNYSKLVTIKLGMGAGTYAQNNCHPQEILGMSVSDPRHDTVSGT